MAVLERDKMNAAKLIPYVSFYNETEMEQLRAKVAVALAAEREAQRQRDADALYNFYVTLFPHLWERPNQVESSPQRQVKP
jgi:hypothetical protein